MKIKNQIRISVLLSLILVVAISVSIIVTYQQVQDLQHQESLAADVVRGGYELTYLSNDYLINAGPRARVQWEERYASLQPIISQLEYGNEEEAQSLEIIRDYNEKTGVLFREIPEPGAMITGAVLFPASYQQVTWSRINVQSQGMLYEAWRLRHLYNNDVNEARFWNNILVLALIAVMLVIISVNYLLISRRLVRSIREVNAGSETFATGNLNYRIPITSDDEISGIAGGLNRMAEQIQMVTASRDELNREIEHRKRAEEEIHLLNTTLEQRVLDRTQELEQATETIRASLDEKVVMLREIHHRVYNNLQILISLLNLQAHALDDETLKKVIRESQNRVKAMALVHERLYQTNDFRTIDVGGYTDYLARSLFNFYEIRTSQVQLTISIKDVMVSLDTAIPLGLIINELISNSLKHAFPAGMKGEIVIDITKDKNIITLLVRDTGIGIPQDFDWRNVKSLGLRLVIGLVEQLRGMIELDRTGGTMFTIVVKEKE